MNHLKTSPVGIDLVVDRIQKRIYPNLLTKWGSLDVYGRCYKIEAGDGLSLEIYKCNGEYQKILFNEGNKIFFIQSNESKRLSGLDYESELWLVCVVNIEDIRSLQHRGDEEVHMDLINELQLYNIDSLRFGMNELKRITEDSFSFGNFKFSDIHPYHVFMVKLNVEYSYSNNC